MMLFRNEDMSAYVKKVHFKLHDRNKYHDIIDSFLDAEHYDTDLLSHSIRSSFLMSGRHSSNMLYIHYDILFLYLVTRIQTELLQNHHTR